MRLLRISGLDLNKVKTALKHRSAILKNAISDENITVNASKACPFGEDVTMVRKITRKYTIFTASEKDEIVKKYENGMSMTAIAKFYGCFHTTVGNVLRGKGVAIRA